MLVDLAEVVAAVAVITGRPARQALDLGGLEEVGNAIGEHGKELYLFGQYGNERWSSTRRRIVSPRPPPGLAAFLRDLPRTLRGRRCGGRLGRGQGARARRAHPPDGRPGRGVRAAAAAAARPRRAQRPGARARPAGDRGARPRHGQGQGRARLVDEVDAGAFLFAGDDLGDVDAFEAVGRLAADGMPTLLVCSASEEESALARLADVVVHGPEGVLDLLRRLTADVRSS